MKTITVYPQDIIPNAKYMCDAEGRCDLLGQIIMSYGIKVPPKTRTPQCLQTGIANFVVCIRQYVYSNTTLTLQLLALSPLSPRKQIAEANKLLASVGVELVTEDQCTRQVIEPVTVASPTASLTLTNLTRTSFYHCSCGQNQSIDSLVDDVDNEGNAMFLCTYCGDELSKEHSLQLVNHFQGK